MLSQEFIEFAINQKVLRFGQFKTKAGRLSPYFFDAGLFNDGKSIQQLAEFYTQLILLNKINFDVLFGAAYKGIPLVVATAMVLAQNGINIPFCFNRKETKDHGEGGKIVGAELKGRVLIMDDVISAGTSVRESVDLIRSQGAKPIGVVVMLDRMEKGLNNLSASQEVMQNYGIPVWSIATLEDLLFFLSKKTTMSEHLAEIAEYREKYGVSNNA